MRKSAACLLVSLPLFVVWTAGAATLGGLRKGAEPSWLGITLPRDAADWLSRTYLILWGGIACATLASAAAWMRARKPRPTASPHPFRCTNCGYDLRATPRRCPECGTPAVTR